MATFAFKMNGNIDEETGRQLVLGFTEQLRNQWDYYIKPHEKEFLLHGKNEQDESIAIDCLILALTKHFERDPSNYQNNALEILQHIRCRKLRQLRSYKMYSLQMF